jgi:hypothetical protein
MKDDEAEERSSGSMDVDYWQPQPVGRRWTVAVPWRRCRINIAPPKESWWRRTAVVSLSVIMPSCL